jgi:16S rRNA (guanine527-N7)-methyltransferase
MTKRAEQPTDDPSLGSFDPALHPPLRFPDEDWQWFGARCASMGIPDCEARREQFEAIYGHLAGVNRWLNLTTITAPREYLKLHMLDSLSLIGDPRLKHLSEGSPCVDLGSGGGYPGLPLALWHPTIPWVLVDSRRKKVEFLAAAAALAMSLSGARSIAARHLRGGETAHAAPDLRRRCQLVVCRAMGQADTVLVEAADLLHKSGHLVIYKGPAFAGEEKQTAVTACEALGYRFIGERRVTLEESDPERVMAVFQRNR